MGNQCCVECIEYIYNEKPVTKKSIKDLSVCGYPFCTTNIVKLKDDSLLVEFNGVIYCSSECRKMHKHTGYICKGWNENNIFL